MLLTYCLTVTIELPILFFISHKWNLSAGLLFCTCMVVNLITQSLLWFSIGFFSASYWYGFILLEMIVFMVESLLYYFVFQSKIQYKQAFWMSLTANGVSFLIGLMMPL
ncbi:MAG: hypothetical protein ACPL3P_01700 [Anaerolineales bacterium]